MPQYGLRRSALAALLLACGHTTGCGDSLRDTLTAPVAPEPASAPSSQTTAPREPSSELIFAADRRDPRPLIDALQSDAVAERRAAAWLLARVPDETTQPYLAHALSDSDATVRAYAAAALGAIEARPAALDESLLGSLAAETDSVARTSILRALGSSIAAEPALAQALAHADESERVTACRVLAQRTNPWPRALLNQAQQLAATDTLPSVREACWFALGRTPITDLPTPGLRLQAIQSLSDANPEVRGGAARVLGRLEADDAARDALNARTRDSEWRVAVQALRAFALTHPSEEAVLTTLTALVAHWWPAGTTPTAGALHVLLTGLDVAAAVARSAPMSTYAATLHTRASHPTEPVTRDAGLLHCAAARLVDLGRGWPTRVESCGLEQVSQTEQAVLSAEVLGAVEGATAQRETFLRRLYRSEDAAVREAVVAACASLPPEAALGWATRGLEDPDLGVTIAAMELATTLATRARQSRDAAAMAAALAGQPAAEGAILPALLPALVALTPRLVTQNHAEALVTFHHLTVALATPEARDTLAPQVSPQRSHPIEAVRASAAEAERALGIESNPPEIRAVPNPLTELRLHARVLHLATSRGNVDIALHPELAPTTVTRIAELVDSGFYEGLTFHRVVAGFVAQGGDPRGDGYGDAGWAQRCEDPPTPYDRGVVGMALAGRDTGGSQFFITTGPAHHLDGHYTAFGHVTAGMEAVDALQAGDTIVHASIEVGESSAPYPDAVFAP